MRIRHQIFSPDYQFYWSAVLKSQIGFLLGAVVIGVGCFGKTMNPATATDDVPLKVAEGFEARLVAGPPLVTHPAMACFDESGNLYVCNNAGVNLSNEELERDRPNEIRRLSDSDGDGRYDTSTVFADQMTFPMGCVWLDGSLYVASPPSIWRLTDSDGDGIAEQRDVLVDRFGFSGNAASIHGCFLGPEGRLHWTDGYHGHEITDSSGRITSKREGSYLFSCRPDGSDVRIHCGGGMDNPVEVDFTESGDMLGTVNILYTRPRVDAVVHWLHGGAYPHRQNVLAELKTTGDFLPPVHPFGHVAVSGTTRYRSGEMDPNWKDHWFATFFNGGQVVRLNLEKQGSTYQATQHEFLTSSSREFHPTDVLEDADGSLLVVNTGGWFYRGCPTSQFAKPEWLGGIYRIRRTEATPPADPRGLKIDWAGQSADDLVGLLRDVRFAVRDRAINRLVELGSATDGRAVIRTLTTRFEHEVVPVRQSMIWTLCRIAQSDVSGPIATDALIAGLSDPDPTIRQSTCQAFSWIDPAIDSKKLIPLLTDSDAAVRLQAAATLGQIGDVKSIEPLVSALTRPMIDRQEEHAILYALIEIGQPEKIRQAVDWQDPQLLAAALIVLDQIEGGNLSFPEVARGLDSTEASTRNQAVAIVNSHADWTPEVTGWIEPWLTTESVEGREEMIRSLLSLRLSDVAIAELVGQTLASNQSSQVNQLLFQSIAQSSGVEPHASWIEPLRSRISEQDDSVVVEVIRAVAALRGERFAAELRTISEDTNRPFSIRMAALSASVQSGGNLSDSTFDQLVEL